MTDAAPLPPLQRLDDRLAGKPTEDVLFPGVPPHLQGSLADWVHELDSICPNRCSQSDEWGPPVTRPQAGALIHAVGLQLNIPSRSRQTTVALVIASVPLDVVVDALLQMAHAFGQPIHDHHLEALRWILHFGRSAYRVADDGRSLELRVDETVRHTALQTMADAEPTIADYLRSAWRNAYKPDSEPDVAYGDAVRAVEQAFVLVVSPRNTRASLGTVCRDLQTQQDKWELVLVDGQDAPASILPVVGLLDPLWQGQRSRHGGGANSRPQSADEAIAAVHLAVLAVQWLASGALRRKS